MFIYSPVQPTLHRGRRQWPHRPKIIQRATSPRILSVVTVHPRRQEIPLHKNISHLSRSHRKKTLPSAPSLALSRGVPAEPPATPTTTGPAPAASAPVVPSSPSLPTWRRAGPLVRLCFHLPLSLAMARRTGRRTARAGRWRTGASEHPQVAVATAATPDAASSH